MNSRFRSFSMRPSYATISWAAIEQTAAYVGTSAGRHRGAYDREHFIEPSPREATAIAEAKGFDPKPRLRRSA